MKGRVPYIEHPSGNSFRMGMESIKTPVSIMHLKAYMGDDEIRVQVKNHIYGQGILPMPISKSCLMLYLKDTKGWESKFTDSVQYLVMLRTIAEIYIFNKQPLPYYDEHKEMIVDFVKNFHENVEKLRKTRNEKIHGIKKDDEEKKVLEYFVQVMMKFTYEYINEYERLLFKSFQMGKDETPFLTEHRFDINGKVLGKTPQDISLFLSHFFEVKQEITNAMMASAIAKHRDKMFFDLEDMKTRMVRLSGDQIFNGFIDRLTLREYYKFMSEEE